MVDKKQYKKVRESRGRCLGPSNWRRCPSPMCHIETTFAPAADDVAAVTAAYSRIVLLSLVMDVDSSKRIVKHQRMSTLFHPILF